MIFDCLSATESLFSSREGCSNIITASVKFKNSVQSDILDEAVQQAVIRHSYFSIKLKRTKDDKRIDIIHNDKKIIVTPNKKNLKFMMEETNNHIQYVQYDENTVTFYIMHAFCDGDSFFRYLHTVLYIYISKRNNVEIEKNGVWLPGDKRYPDENVDPIVKAEELGEDIVVPKPKKNAEDMKTFNMSTLGNYDLKNTMYKMTLPKEAFIKFSKSVKSSPATIMPGLLAKSIFDLKGSLGSEIILGVVMHNARKVLNCPNAWTQFSNALPVIYVDLMKYMDKETLYSLCRDGVYRYLNKELTIKNFLNKAYRAREILDGDFKNAKSVAFDYSSRDSANVTFITSYVGRLNWGNLESYIEEIVFPIAPEISGLAVELTAMNDIFTMTITQPFEEDIYVKYIKKLLEEDGVECKLSEAIPFNPPYYLPEYIEKYD